MMNELTPRTPNPAWLGLRCPFEMIEKLKEIAAKRGVTTAAYVRYAVEKQLTKDGLPLK
jgi:predicted DNA-binding protein